jgi:hypothetical protein
MSRAFVKERDAEAVEELPDRSLSDHPNDVTPEGLTQIDAELALARAAFAASQKSNDRAGLGVGLSRYAVLGLPKSDRPNRIAAG